MKKNNIHILQNRWAAITHDLFMIPVAWLLSYWLRFNLGDIPDYYSDAALRYLILVVPIQAFTLWFYGLYRGIWRFASIPDLVRILKSVGLGAGLAIGFIFILDRFEGVPRSVPILYFILLTILLGGPRLLYRWFKDGRVAMSAGKRVLIVGAGDAGEALVRDMLRSSQNDYQPVAFVDDKPEFIGKEIHGVPITATTSDIPAQVADLSVEIVILAVPSAVRGERKRLIELCEQAEVPFQTVPQLDSLMSGQVNINQLREVSIEDLLGREPVSLDWDGIRSGLAGGAILITGAGGSIGSELCRQIAELNPDRLILVENSEFNLYSIEMDLSNRFPNLMLHASLIDVKDEAALEVLFQQYQPNVVFHAAAYKHVPLLESQIREAVSNNIMGTRNVANMSDRYGVSEFILISTDKAVNPTNVMGTTKRISELYCQNFNAHSKTRFVTVRFGNVLGSAGSVVPLFRKQIMDGGPVTVTHVDIERYFMTIPEACQLIMQASILGQGGEIFVLDMGEPVKIEYLARQLILLSGRTPGEDIEITFTGLRPGEKLYEELFHDNEKLNATGHDKILLSACRETDWDALLGTFNEMSTAVNQYDEAALFSLLLELVPECAIKPAINSQPLRLASNDK